MYSGTESSQEWHRPARWEQARPPSQTPSLSSPLRDLCDPPSDFPAACPCLCVRHLSLWVSLGVSAISRASLAVGDSPCVSVSGSLSLHPWGFLPQSHMCPSLPLGLSPTVMPRVHPPSLALSHEQSSSSTSGNSQLILVTDTSFFSLSFSCLWPSAFSLSSYTSSPLPPPPFGPPLSLYCCDNSPLFRTPEITGVRTILGWDGA